MPSVFEILNMPYRKRIPYGMMNFVAVREDDCYYVDKTHYIPLIERANKFFFFIRPRRFGKSLTLSMLRHYYDINEADKFEQWYGDLYKPGFLPKALLTPTTSSVCSFISAW